MAMELRSQVAELEENICRVVLGKSEVVRMCLVALLAGEHVLLEDVPGVGKTLVAKALAKSLYGDFCRLQFTPDLLPSDIVGSSVYNNQAFHKFRGFSGIEESNSTTKRITHEGERAYAKCFQNTMEILKDSIV
mgnify:CR=1 FL=1